MEDNIVFLLEKFLQHNLLIELFTLGQNLAFFLRNMQDNLQK